MVHDAKKAFEKLLRHCIEIGASDLHLSACTGPMVRIHGLLRPLDAGGISPDLDQTVEAIMNPRQRKVFEQEQTLDLAYALASGERSGSIYTGKGVRLLLPSGSLRAGLGPLRSSPSLPN